MMEDSEESYTANLKNWQWYAVVEKKAHRGRLWRVLVKDQYIQGMWEYFPVRD